MQIDKVYFTGVSTTSSSTQKPATETPVQEASTESKDKSKLTKYLVGSTLLAGVVALGIWGRDKYLRNKLANAEKSLIDEAEKIFNDALKLVKPGVAGVPTPTVPGNKLSSIPGEILKEGSRPFKIIKNENGDIVRRYNGFGGFDDVFNIDDIDPKTGKIIKNTLLERMSGNPSSVTDYDLETGNIVKKTRFNFSNGIAKSVEDFDPKTNIKIKQTFFDGNTGIIGSITDFDQVSGNEFRKFSFTKGNLGEMIKYDPATGEKIEDLMFWNRYINQNS